MTSAQPDSEIAKRPPPGRATFRRVLLELSGEALMGDQLYGVDPARVEAIAREVTRVRRDGVETGLVIGAGNIHRGLEALAERMDRATADCAGMLAVGDKRAYDPRAWGRNTEQAMAARVVEACRQPGSAGRSITGR